MTKFLIPSIQMFLVLVWKHFLFISSNIIILSIKSTLAGAVYVGLATIAGFVWWFLYSDNGPKLSYTELVSSMEQQCRVFVPFLIMFFHVHGFVANFSSLQPLHY